MTERLLPVIISGGAGTRLWPVSRESHPKPFLKLSDGQSLLQKTFLRAQALPQVTNILTVTNRELYFKTEDEYQLVNTQSTPVTYLLEPFGRNTAAAIVAAALHAHDQYLLILPADHLIQKKEAFEEAVKKAFHLAKEKYLVTFGITPEYPETGYGYIEVENVDDIRVKKFVEKPTIEKAKDYLSSGKHFWNAGIFCFHAGVLLDEMKKYAPEILAAVSESFVKAKKSSFVELDYDSYSAIPDISIDYAVMEKSTQVAVVNCDIGWSDIGSWNALNELTTPDAQGNRIEGEALLHDVKNCYIQSQDRLVAAVGVENLIIVDTPDALLVSHQDCVQDVKHIVQKLKQNNHESHKVHKTAYRPWGAYTVLEEGERFKIKRIEVKPGASLSLQMHHHRSEHWVVVSGMAKITNGEKSILLNSNESTFIPAGHKHRLENPGVVDLILIEVQSGDYLGEDDIVRFDDNYGRHA